MKKYLFFLIIFYLAISAYSQHYIERKNGTVINAQVVKVTKEGITYTETGINEPSFIQKSHIRYVTYQNTNDDNVLENPQACEIKLPDIGIAVVCWQLKEEIPWKIAKEQSPKGYRLPTMKELKYMCKIQKMIGLVYNDEYWSLTNKKDKAFSVSCDDCRKEKNYKERTRAIRYVRDL